MSTILYIKANPKETENSRSLSLSEAFVNAYKEAASEDEVIKINLYSTDIPELDYDLLHVIENLKKGITPDQLSEDSRNKLAAYNRFTEQFMQADKYIFTTPMWNLGLPSRVKAYIDTVCVAGKTFKYTEKGPQGLMENKKCLHIHASGGVHANKPYNHADPYLRDIMGFMGVTDYKTLCLEGVDASRDQAEAILKQTYDQIPNTVEWFK